MSFDLRIGVKVADLDNVFVEIASPEYDSPTYNISKMFRVCTGWDFEQGVWYSCKDVLPKIKKGISELIVNEEEYLQYNAPNGWGDTQSALRTLQSLLQCIQENSKEGGSFTDVPLDHLWVKW